MIIIFGVIIYSCVFTSFLFWKIYLLFVISNTLSPVTIVFCMTSSYLFFFSFWENRRSAVMYITCIHCLRNYILAFKILTKDSFYIGFNICMFYMLLTNIFSSLWYIVILIYNLLSPLVHHDSKYGVWDLRFRSNTNFEVS